ncbi:Fe-S cluster assembly protein SufD [Paenibacillus azoreducens]|uniref:Fe-S cluster assembly protein SufD n=1 Tax=Paenibacillus azoreducens TaxID=116718 RepID=A0A920CVD8_9BACL|nr:Fe-S cluster assembly protein SufD [Paenibacillus azoreducens]GIO51324.1 Fe-S cluster assembly protein SufD [Paenibacillus azoreducens]
MSMSKSTAFFDRKAAAAIARSKQEPSWLVAWREEAGEWAAALELPKPEKTPIDRWMLDAQGEYRPGQTVSLLSELPSEVLALLDEQVGGAVIVQHNSSVVYSRLPEELKAQGVVLSSLEEAARTHEELVRTHLMTAYARDEHKLSAMHAAMWNGSVFLYVPRGVEIAEPVQAVLYADDAEAAFVPHLLVIADEGSRVCFMENAAASLGETETTLFHNGAVEVFAKRGARVQYAAVHHMDDTAIDISFRRAVLADDARIEWLIGDLHEGNTLSDTKTILKGTGSTSDAKVITVGTGSQRMSLTTGAVHIGRSSESDMVTRAVITDEATVIINGITKIEKGSAKANGQQTERVLMLSPKARGDANPILLIDEDDVMAGHAASVGQVNAEQVYYLMSRGIARSAAERLIIYGFLDPVVSEIPVEAVRKRLQQILERKLG